MCTLCFIKNKKSLMCLQRFLSSSLSSKSCAESVSGRLWLHCSNLMGEAELRVNSSCRRRQTSNFSHLSAPSEFSVIFGRVIRVSRPLALLAVAACYSFMRYVFPHLSTCGKSQSSHKNQKSGWEDKGSWMTCHLLNTHLSWRTQTHRQREITQHL